MKDNRTIRNCPSGSFAYTIRSGDTLYLLAQRYNTTVEAIMRINPGINPNNLQIGQTVCIPGSVTPPPTTCPSGSFSYTIRSGDTLYLLAQRYNTTVEAIMRINPGINPNNLQIGQMICIPGSVTPPPTTCPSGSFSYTIRSGDTLYLLAQRYNTTVEAIMRINPGINPNNLQIGQMICIPGSVTPPPPTRCPAGSFEYTIRSGDTLFTIANRYNTTVNAILALNPGIDPNNLRVGQIICIPEKSPQRCPAGSFEYTIRSGDTLFTIANRYNTTVNAILALNPGLDPNNLVVGMIICIPEKSPQRCPAGSFEYTIRSGDTLFTIANRYNTTVNAILALNPGLDPNNLRVGMVICVPEEKPQRCPAGSFEYTIRSGDTLFSIANRYNTTVNAILAINPGLDPNNLRVGMVICVPEGGTPTPPCDGVYYVVRAGDTLYSIARMYNTTVAKLMEANPGVDPNNLRVGQMICIPRMSPPLQCPGGTIYVVKSKDTLSSILLKLNISIMDLMEGNPDINLEKLSVGQELCILPHENRGCPCPKGTKPYIISADDIDECRNESVIEYLADKFNVTVISLFKANPNLAADDYVEGMRICVPVKC